MKREMRFSDVRRVTGVKRGRMSLPEPLISRLLGLLSMPERWRRTKVSQQLRGAIIANPSPTPASRLYMQELLLYEEAESVSVTGSSRRCKFDQGLGLLAFVTSTGTLVSFWYCSS